MTRNVRNSMFRGPTLHHKKVVEPRLLGRIKWITSEEMEAIFPSVVDEADVKRRGFDDEATRSLK